MHMPWKYGEEIFLKHFLNLLSVIMCAGDPLVYESVCFSGPTSQGTSVSSCGRQMMKPNTKSDARGAMDEPVIAVKPRARQQKPNSPKKQPEAGPGLVAILSVTYAKFIISKGKVAAEWGGGHISLPVVFRSPSAYCPKRTHISLWLPLQSMRSHRSRSA
jgi:hypothetical protein